MMRFLSLVPTLTVLVAPTRAQDDTAARLTALEQKNAELEARLSALADEQEGFTLGGLVPPLAESRYGLGPAASKVYAASEGLSLGGYAEWLYERRNGATSDEVDALRVVTYLGYRFDEHWVLNSEIEFEHAGEEVGVEFAYLDYLWREELNFRMGLVLIPMGFVNELHEPPTFLAAKRTELERRILPTTWRENGLGVFGDAGGLSYRAYLVNGFDATGFTDQGLRGGRQNGSEALAEDLALTGRLDWTETPGLVLGVAAYFGDAGQEQAGLAGTTTAIFDLHGEWRAGGLWTRALVAQASVDDVAELNAAQGFVGADSVGEELEGFYVEAGYDVLTVLAPGSGHALSPYLRYESLDTQAEVPGGFAADPANDFDVLTAGLNWRPRTNLVFKAEYQDNEQSEDGWNLLMGLSF
ncbi:MAG: hypothetical protein ABL998_10375 [Planctomycetota bacterium]